MKSSDLHVLLRIALARSDLYARAGRGLRVLSLLIGTVQTCLRRHYHQLLWEAVGALARLLVAEGEFRAARALLNLVIPRVLQAGDSEMTALLYLHLGDAHMGLAGQVQANSGRGDTSKQTARMKQHLARTWWCLGRAQAHAGAAGAGETVRGEITAKQKTILAVSQRFMIM